MKVIPILSLVVSAFFIIPCASAKGKKGGKGGGKNNAEAEAKEKERDDRRENLARFLEEFDTDNNRTVSKDEFVAGSTKKEGAEERFATYDKNRSGNLERSEIETYMAATAPSKKVAAPGKKGKQAKKPKGKK